MHLIKGVLFRILIGAALLILTVALSTPILHAAESNPLALAPFVLAAIILTQAALALFMAPIGTHLAAAVLIAGLCFAYPVLKAVHGNILLIFLYWGTVVFTTSSLNDWF